MQGFLFTRADSAGDINHNIDISGIKVLIIGNEGQGISEEVLNSCDDYLYIKMSDNCESLNAAIAASIIMYELNR